MYFKLLTYTAPIVIGTEKNNRVCINFKKFQAQACGSHRAVCLSSFP